MIFSEMENHWLYWVKPKNQCIAIFVLALLKAVELKHIAFRKGEILFL